MFERYRNIVDNWQAFQESISQPLPTTVRINTLRTNRSQVVEELGAVEIPARPIEGFPQALEVPKETRVARSWLYHAGHIHLQELVSMLPVRVLPIQQHQTVLDLCAAPGNKSAQAAVALNNTGTVWANDVSPGRIHALKGVFDHHGLINAAVMTQNAMTMQSDILFDHVIADVPCTCEGTIRKNLELADAPPTLDAYHRYHNIQKTILHRAIDLVKPGGYVVYSTCTFAPEENEAVLSAVLNERADIDVQSIPELGLQVSPGILEWEGIHFHPQVLHAIRLWPHHNNTGGFFVALLRKRGQAVVPGEINPLVSESEVRDYVYDSLHGRFGISKHFLDQHCFFKVGAKKIAVSHPHVQFPDRNFVSRGMTLCKVGRHTMKPSTQAALYFGEHMTKNVVALEHGQAREYFSVQEQEISDEQLRNVESDGLVACAVRGVVVGIGNVRNNKLHSLFPKAWATSN